MPLGDKPPRLADDGARFARSRTSVTAKFAYFVSTGKLQRLPLAGGEAETLAEDAEEIAPAAVSWGSREAVAYVAKRRTKDGERRARLWVDKEAIDLSQEGAGGTAVALLATETSLRVGWLDQRTALVPLHLATVEGGPLRVTERRLAWNAPPSDQPMDVSLTLPKDVLVGLLAVPKNGVDFGLARVPLAADTREEAVWSLYPNGLDPAPALGFSACGRGAVAFVRPAAKAPDAPRAVMVAEVADDGSLSEEREVATAKQVDHLAVSATASGAWIAWAGDGRTWVRRLRCP